MNTNNGNLESYRALRFNEEGIKEFSNFYLNDFEFMGYQFHSAECAFQACKLIDVDSMTRFKAGVYTFMDASPSYAKKLGRAVKLPDNWEDIKAVRMYEVLCAKFKQSTYLLSKLNSTGKRFIIEDNTWHDNTWGMCTCQRCQNGRKIHNELGLLLMLLRSEVRGEERLEINYCVVTVSEEIITGVVDLLDENSVHALVERSGYRSLSECVKFMK